MKKIHWGFIIFNLLLFSIGQAQSLQERVQQMVKETQITHQKEGKISICWWIPNEFWEFSMKANQVIPEEESQTILDLLRPYQIVALAEVKMGLMGETSFKNYDQLKEGLYVRVSESTILFPLEEDKVSQEVLNLMAIMNPILKNILGPLGDNLQFFIFDALNSQGTRYLDPTQKGHFSLYQGHELYSYELPLSALIPPRYCPRCGKRMKGSWNFCPFHGVPLDTIPLISDKYKQDKHFFLKEGPTL